ncbi:mycothiol synthase, partial [Cellulomonas algicola]
LLDAARAHAAGTHTGADAALKVWAHGDLPPARAFAAATGLVVVRELRKLRLHLADRTDATRRPMPAGTTLRTFVPGQDEEAWRRVNARAFAHHPEQGRLTVADVRAREREPWFDPAGFLLAERDGVLVGSVWTKVHPAGTEADEPVGEIYVVGVDPDAQGTGLGAALTSAGLDHLASRGLATVVLYVDADNTAAVRTYDRQGFVRAATDVMLASDTEGSPAGATMGS